MWHIKKLIKHYTGAPCAGDNKRPLKGAIVTTQCQMSHVEGACNWHDVMAQPSPSTLCFFGVIGTKKKTLLTELWVRLKIL